MAHRAKYPNRSGHFQTTRPFCWRLHLARCLNVSKSFKKSSHSLKFKKVMLSFFTHWCSTRNCRIRINQLSWVIGRTAYFAAITILVFGMTFRAFAFNKTIRQKHVFDWVIKLFYCFSRNFSVGFQLFIDALRKLFILCQNWSNSNYQTPPKTL